MINDMILQILNRFIDLERIQNFISPIINIILVLLVVLGLLNCLLGFRLMRFWMMLGGFFLGVLTGYVASDRIGFMQAWQYLALMFVLGLLLGGIAFMVYKAGVFLLGAAIGLFLGFYFIQPEGSSAFFICVLIGLALGVLAVKFSRSIIITGTSVLGGIMAGLSLAGLFNMDLIPYGWGMSAGFAILGIIIQALTNRRTFKEEDERSENMGRGKYDDDYMREPSPASIKAKKRHMTREEEEREKDIEEAVYEEMYGNPFEHTESFSERRRKKKLRKKSQYAQYGLDPDDDDYASEEEAYDDRGFYYDQDEYEDPYRHDSFDTDEDEYDDYDDEYEDEDEDEEDYDYDDRGFDTDEDDYDEEYDFDSDEDDYEYEKKRRPQSNRNSSWEFDVNLKK